MSAQGTVPLESARLAAYSEQVPCYICSGENAYDAELCRHCSAPMALALQSDRGRPPHLVAAIGATGAGKTVYLGMLTDMLSRRNDQLHLLARGAFSITLQQTTIGALAKCDFPDKTPNEPDRWNWMHCQIAGRSRSQPLELIMPDMAGESLIQEVDHPHSYPVIRQFLSRCWGVQLLIDAARLYEGGQEQDFFTMKLLSYLCELDPHPKRGWGRRPIALVFTKADQCEDCFDDPEAFAKQWAPGLHRLCLERLKRYRFFAAGVAGACAHRWAFGRRVTVPLRIEPRGIVEPFQWLLKEMGHK